MQRPIDHMHDGANGGRKVLSRMNQWRLLLLRELSSGQTVSICVRPPPAVMEKSDAVYF